MFRNYGERGNIFKKSRSTTQKQSIQITMMFKKNTAAPRRPARRLVPRKTMHARAASSREEIEEYEGESEPSMKLSQAFIVVLVLHVVAVAGIYGFNQLKEKPARPAPVKAETAEATSATAPASQSEKKAEPLAKTDSTASAKSQEAQSTYTVVAGDTLRRIATKFNTSIEALEKANNLTSTSILKVGQIISIGSGSKTHQQLHPHLFPQPKPHRHRLLSPRPLQQKQKP
jgi:LysM repeat protein